MALSRRIADKASKKTASSVPEAPGTLYTHEPHAHTPRNANERHREERQTRIAAGGIRGFNERLAIRLSGAVSTMWTAYLFTVLALVTIFAVLGWFGVLSPLVAAVGEAVSQTFIQLVFLPILALVSSVQSRQSEIQADEQYHTSLRNLHDIEQVARHLDAQDAALIELRDRLRLMSPAATLGSSSTSTPGAPPAPLAPTTPSVAPSRPKRPRSSASTSPTA